MNNSSTNSLALLLHEFATNATKYGALVAPEGTIEFECIDDGDNLTLLWTERGGPRVDSVGKSEHEGFGSHLIRMSVEKQLGGEITRDWAPEGLVLRVTIPRSSVARQAEKTAA